MTKNKFPPLTVYFPDTSPLEANSSCLSPREMVNGLRHKALTEHAGWVWLIDRDCLLDEATKKSANSLLAFASERTFLIGGLYSSHPSQTLWERSYNVMCNLWSWTYQTPLAGNVLVQTQHLPKDFHLHQIPFGQEEHYLKFIADREGLRVEIRPDLKLRHENQKSFRKWIATCWFQASRKTSATPPHAFKRSFPVFWENLKSDPTATVLALLYFFLSRSFQLVHALTCSKTNA